MTTDDISTMLQAGGDTGYVTIACASSKSTTYDCKAMPR